MRTPRSSAIRAAVPTILKVLWDPVAAEELYALRTYDRRRIEDGVEKNLTVTPLVRTRKRKPLETIPSEVEDDVRRYFPDGVPSIWQLMVGAHRILYAMIDDTVYVLRVVEKGRLTTGDALS